MFTPKLSSSEINYIRVSLGRLSTEDISSEIGRAKSTVRGKVNEIKANERVQSLSEYARLKKKRVKHKAKRKIKGGM